MHELSALLEGPKTDKLDGNPADPAIKKVVNLLQKRKGLFSRSICVRMVDAGSSNDVEIEEGLMNSPQVDCERFGIHFVASPRHADVLLVSGPVALNMRRALEKTFDAMAEPRAVVAAGDGACTGGLLKHGYAVYQSGRVDEVVPVDVRVTGNPPSPYDLIAGILQAGIKLEKKMTAARV